MDECINCGECFDEGTHCPECTACGYNEWQFCECGNTEPCEVGQ